MYPLMVDWILKQKITRDEFTHEQCNELNNDIFLLNLFVLSHLEHVKLRTYLSGMDN